MTCIAGIDSGSVNPGLALISSISESVSVEDLPPCNDQVDAVSVACRLEQMKPDMIFADVSARLLQGLSSTFRLGVAIGIIIGVIDALRVPVQFVAPTVWKRHFHLGREKKNPAPKPCNHSRPRPPLSRAKRITATRRPVFWQHTI